MKQTLHISKELRKRLKRIAHPISELLLKTKKIDDQIPNYINYLGISKDNKDFISYMTQERVTRWSSSEPKLVPIIDLEGYKMVTFLKKYDLSTLTGNTTYRGIKDYMVFVLPTHSTGNIFRWYTYQAKVFTKQFQPICITNIYFNRRIEFETCNIPESVIDDRDMLWEPNNRYHAKAGKTLRKLFGDRFKDKEWEEFSNLYKTEALKEAGDFMYEEITGEEIKKCYLEENAIQRGDISSSCMRYSNCQEYFDIYIKNPNNCALAIFKKNNKVYSRSLIWSGIREATDKKFFDRIYAASEPIKLQMEQMFKERRYVSIYERGNSKFDYHIDLHVGTEEIKKFPYMDTWQYITGKELATKDGYWQLRSTTGGYTIVHPVTKQCSHCGSDIIETKLKKISDGSIRCNECYVWHSNEGIYIPVEDSVYCEYYSNYRYERECVVDYKGNYIDNNWVVVLYNGEYAWEDDADIIQSKDGEWFVFRDSNFEEVNGEYIRKQENIVA